MGVSKQQVAANRRLILDAAAKLFRERGVDAVGIVELMEAAGMTRGGFYNHFKSKEALVAAVLEDAMQRGEAVMQGTLSAAAAQGDDLLEAQIAWYMSPGHRADIAAGCPISGFAGDARRLAPESRQLYADGVVANIAQLAALVGSQQGLEADRKRAMRMLTGMVGALVLSRAVMETNPGLADEILAEGRHALETLHTEGKAASA